MIMNYEEHGFRVTAAVMPEACTACPFYLYNIGDDSAICFLTGSDIPTNGPQDESRAPDCPIMPEYIRYVTLGDARVRDIEKLKRSCGCILTVCPMEEPTVTDIRIVRCKDCKHHREAHYEDEGEPPYIKHVCNMIRGRQFDPNFYCAYGERKTDKDNVEER